MPIEAADDVLTERAQRLLKVLIESYIRDGQPVGSRTLSRESGLNLSSATIRNVMADLEDSASSLRRIPPRGACRPTRAIVCSSIPCSSSSRCDGTEVAELQRRLEEHSDEPKALVAAASQVLSDDHAARRRGDDSALRRTRP